VIDTRGYVSVAEAAARLRLSPEQVRRRLRCGKLKGERVGNQWFVDSDSLTDRGQARPERLIPKELSDRIDARREALRRRGVTVDVVAALRELREGR
jgi:excisionase family DNA binding protein